MSEPREPTRRTLLRGGLAAGAGAAALSLAGPAGARAAQAAAAAADAKLLSGLASLEQAAAGAYPTLARRGVLTRADADLADVCARRAEAHLKLLNAPLKRLGAPVGAPRTGGARTALLGPLAKVRTRADALGFGVEQERRTVAAYHDAIGRLQDAAALRSAAEIVADHGLQLANWRVAAGQDPLPRALETGAAP